MKSEEVLKLIEAGFTADEIRSMQDNKEESAGDASPAENSSTSEETKVEKAHEENNDPVKDLGDAVKTLNDTVKAIQENNIKNAHSESPMDSVNKNINDFLNSL